ncbi:MAG: hypothetical protein IK005_01265, partial [Paludibacteraceae bacterium]|nr:hypothetical protein [Paludibacteraceae bacterium]
KIKIVIFLTQNKLKQKKNKQKQINLKQQTNYLLLQSPKSSEKWTLSHNFAPRNTNKEKPIE